MRVVCSLVPDAVVALLTPEMISRLRLFCNYDSTEAVFDHLWDDPDSVDVVVIAAYEVVKDELNLAAGRRHGTQFIVIGHHEHGDGVPTSNIAFCASLDDLDRAITPILDRRNDATSKQG